MNSQCAHIQNRIVRLYAAGLTAIDDAAARMNLLAGNVQNTHNLRITNDSVCTAISIISHYNTKAQVNVVHKN